MALPTTSRPREIEEELELEKPGLKIILKKHNLFFECIGEWYKNKLSAKERGRLTKKRLLRRAIYEAFNMKIPFHSLPKDWIGTLKTKFGLILYRKVKKAGKVKKVKSGSDAEDSDSVVCLSSFRTPGFTSSGRPSAAVVGGPVAVAEAEPDPDPSQEPVPQTLPKFRPKEDVKKLIDLSDETPPGWWLQSYAKGIVLERRLVVHSEDDMNIIFYDYEQKGSKNENEPKTKAVPHDMDGISNKFDWWKTETLKEERAMEIERYRQLLGPRM